MRRALKWALRAAAGLAILALILAIAAVIVVQTSWFREKVRERIVYEIEQATGGRVELQSFDFNWKTLTATVKGLVIHGKEDPQGAPLFRAETIAVGLKIISVFKKQVDIQSAAVEKPQINVIVFPDGTTNLPEPAVARKPGAKSTLETVLDLAIRRFQITDGTVQFALRRMPLNVLGENLRAQISYVAGPARYQGGVAFRSLDVKPGELAPIPIEVSSEFALQRNRVDIGSLHLGMSNSSLDVKGSVENFAAPEVKLEYTGRVNLHELPRGLKLGPFPNRGSIALSGRVDARERNGYALNGRIQATGLAFQERGLYIENIRVDSAVSVTPERVDFRDLKVGALGGQFIGSAEIVKFHDWRVDGEVRDFALREATRLRLEGIHEVEWNGTTSGPVQIRGEIRKGELASLIVRTEQTISPAEGPNPVSGMISLTYDRAGGTVTFAPSSLNTRYSRIGFSGVLGREMRVAVETTNLDDARPGIAMFVAGPPPQMPVRIESGGVARFRGALLGPLSSPQIQGHGFMTNFVVEGRRFDRGEADAVVSRDGVVATNVVADRLGTHATGSLRVGFRDWRPEPDQPVDGRFVARAPNLAEVITATAVKNPLDVSSGPITANVTLSGTIGDLAIGGNATAVKVSFYGQPIDRVQGEAQYTKTALDIRSAELHLGKSNVRVSGNYAHAADDWEHGNVRFQVASTGVPIADLKALRDRASGLDGRVQGEMSGELAIMQAGFRPGALSGHVAVQDLAVEGRPMGSFSVTATTGGSNVEAVLQGEVAGSKITGKSTLGLTGDYPVRGALQFTPLAFSNLYAVLHPSSAGAESPFRGSVEGDVEFSGLATDFNSWKGTLRIPTLEVRPGPGYADVAQAATELSFRNVGPILLDLDVKGARIRQAEIRGKDTDLKASGRIGFGARNPWDLRAQGSINLALLRDFDRRLYSSGSVAIDVSVRGPLDKPEVYGRLDLRNASVNLTNFPNGIDRANGTVFLYRDRAIIDKLEAESGGGKIAVTGFVSLAGTMTFHLQAKATDVRVRYPEGMSFTADTALSFTGTTDRSVLSGDVTITRVGFNPRSDLASLLAQTAQPIQAAPRQSRFEQGLRFDIRIQTSPQVRFETKLTRDIQADASLRLRGDLTRPVLLGRITINSGEVLFFGNRYMINSGQILFVNAAKIEPDVSLDLETRVRGIDVTLHVAGVANRLNVSYSSDPPLQFSEILTLLTTGREPTAAPGLGGPQAQLGTWQQAGASTLLSQAIASPIAGRLQRFFGVSRLKIDPQITGLTTSNAAARLTLEQNITSNLTFTYITDLSRAQAQVIRIEWDLTNNWSAVAVREENGLFGIDFLYRKQVK